MFEGIVAKLLTNALGTYIEDLNSEKLNVSIWGGDVSLTNLVIKQSALDELNLPCRVVFGHIGRLTLKIPWSNIFEGQWIAEVDGVVVIANPNTSIKYDKEEEKRLQQEAKKAKLKQLEEDHEKERNKDEANAAQGDTFFEKLSLGVIKNIQITIKNIHIRYEDDLSVPGRPFSAGITLNKLSMLSTDSTWKATLHKEKLVYKLNEMDGLAVYMNPQGQMYSQSSSMVQLRDSEISAAQKKTMRSEMTENLIQLIASKEKVPPQMNYVIGPIYAITKLTICPRPELDSFQNPKVLMDFDMEELYIGLSRQQFLSSMSIAESFDSMNRSSKFREFRPDVKEKKGNARLWWIYAYNSVMVDIQRQSRNWRWSRIIKHRGLCKEYLRLYKMKLEKGKCSASEEKEIDDCEQELDTFNIRLIRKQAEIEFEREGKKKEKAAAAQRGWLGSWWYGSKPDEESQTEGIGVLKQIAKSMSEEEKKQFHASIGYSEDQVDAKEEYPKVYKDLELKLLLRLLVVNIKDEECGGASVTKASLVNVNSHLMRRPACDSWRVSSKLQSFMVEGFNPVDSSGSFMDALEEFPSPGVEVGLDATSDSLPPQLVQSLGIEDDKPLVQMLFETNPEYVNADQHLGLKACPLKIIYDLTTVNQLQSVFAPPKNISLQQLQADALNHLEVVKERSVTGLQAAIDNQTNLDLHIYIEASRIIIPENGLYKPDCSVLVLTLGSLKMDSIEKNAGDLLALNQEGKSEMEIKSIMENKSYDSFSIQLIDIQVVLAFSGESWGNCLEMGKATPLHLLQPTTIQVNFMRSVFQRDSDPNLAKFKVNVELSKVALSVIDQRLLQLAYICNSISGPEGDLPMDVDEEIDTDLNMNIIGEDVALERLENAKMNTNNESSESPQVFELALSFVVKEMCLELLEKETPLFKITALDAKIEVEKRTFDLTAKVTLQGMIIKSLKGEGYDLLKTQGETFEPLLSLDATNVSPKVPDFHSKYNSTVQLLKLKVTHLKVHLERAAILSLMKFSDELSVKLNQLNPSEHQQLPTLVRQLSKASSKLSLSSKLTSSSTGKKKAVIRTKTKQIIQVHMLIEVDQVSLVIGIKGQNFAEAAVVGMDLDVKKKGESLEISSKLKDLNVMDPSDAVIHKKILSVVGREVWRAHIVMHGDASEDRKLIDTDCVDMSVQLAMGQPRYIFLNKFVNQILMWLEAFQSAKEAVASAGGAAAAAARANLQEAYKQSYRVKLNITLKAPLILMPQNSTSHSGILVDLGEITIINAFRRDQNRNELGHYALFDHIDLQLENVKISRLNNISPTGEWEDGKLMIKDPISFLLKVERNLTISWFTAKPEIDIEAKLKPIKVVLSDEDIQMMMVVLQDNLGEEATITQTSTLGKDADAGQSASDAQEANQILAVAGHVYKRLSFSFTIEELTLELLAVDATLSSEKSATKLSKSRSSTSVGSIGSQGSQNSISSLGKKKPFAMFSIHKIDLKGDMHSNSIFTANLVLNNCILQDTRPGHEGYITKMFERQYASGDKGMIDITYKMDQDGSQFVQVNISGIKVALHLPYLFSVQQFFMDSFSVKKETEPLPQPKTEFKKDFTRLKSVVEENRVAAQKGNILTIRVKVESPDIAVVEDVTSIDTSAIILHTEFNADIRLSPEQQNIGAAMTRLEMYTCCYNPEKRQETMSQILSPCEVSFYTAKNSSHPQIFSLKIGHIDLRVSPANISLLTSISMVLSQTDDTPVEETDAVYEWPRLWEPKPLEPTMFPFMAVEEAMEASTEVIVDSPSLSPSDGNETGEVQVETILVTLETGSGISPMPLIKLQLNAIITVTGYLSSMLKANGQMDIVVVYYNGRLAVWETLLEPVIQGRSNSHEPWKLDFEVEQMLVNTPSSSPSRSMMSSPIGSPDMEEYEFTPYEKPLCTIKIDAKDPLELTITKTFMEVQTVLSTAFADAYKQKMEARMGPSAPFRVVNNTGMKINVALHESTFQMREKDVANVTLENLACVDLSETKPATPKHKRAFSLISETGLKERSIKIQVPSLNGECNIPVTRADKRYFMIDNKESGEPWGLVATISVDGGCKIITLSSSVKVVNHLDVDVEVYYMMDHGNEVDFALKLAPGEEQRLPLHAVHTPSAEIFFAVQGHSVSIVPFVWRGLQSRTHEVQELRCNPRNMQEVHATPFIISASGTVEQILFEDTARRTLTSVLYCIELRSAMVLYNLLPVSLSLDPPGTVDAKTWLMPGRAIYLNKAVRGACYLEIQINDYQGRDWICGKTIELSPLQASVWTFSSLHKGIGGSHTIDLGMHVVEEKGTLSLSLYCPFWMINKTGQMLTYKGETSNNVIIHEPNNNEAVLFSFKSKAFFGKKKAAVMVGESQWSEKFSLDVVGSSGLLTCKDQDRIYQLGIDIQLSSSGLTKMVVFTPFFKIYNKAPYDVEVNEGLTPEWVTILSNECIGWWPIGNCKQLRVRIQDTRETTCSFSYENPLSTLLRLDNKFGGIYTEVSVSEGGVLVQLRQCEEGATSVLIINHLSENFLTIWQEGQDSNKIIVVPDVIQHYSWSNPTNERRLNWAIGDEKSTEKGSLLDRDEKGVIEDGNGVKGYHWVVFMFGAQRCLLFTEDESVANSALYTLENDRIMQDWTVDLHSIGLSLVDDVLQKEVAYLCMKSSGVVWEHCKIGGRKHRPFTAAQTELIEKCYQMYQDQFKSPVPPQSHWEITENLVVEFATWRVLKPFKRKIRRTFQPGLQIQLNTSTHCQRLNMKVNSFQLDNQLTDGVVFPVVLARVPPPRSVMAETVPKPFFEVSIQQLFTSNNFTHYKWFAVLVQEFHVKVELPFVYAILEVLFPTAPKIVSIYSPEKYEADSMIVQKELSSLVASQSAGGRKEYFDNLHLSPIKMHLSFSLSGSDSGSAVPVGGQVIQLFLQSVGVTLSEVQDVVFRLAYMEHLNRWMSWGQLIQEVIQHYQRQVVKQLYVLVLGLDVIGNPYGLMVGLTKGVEDLFYEPIQGAIEGPGEFAEGMLYGVSSFMGKTFGGAAGAVGRITGTLGKGVAALTLDDEYQKRRRAIMHRKPTDGIETLARGGKGLVTGVFDGVTGIFTKPVEGAMDEGVGGFFKGVGKGVVGLVTRPASGVIDFASGGFDALKGITDSTEEITQQRPARFISSTGIIEPYSHRSAYGAKILRELDKGRYAMTDYYVAHAMLHGHQSLLLATDIRVFQISHHDMMSHWKVDWIHTYEEMAEVPRLSSDQKRIHISIKQLKRRVMSVFGGGDNSKTTTMGDPQNTKVSSEQQEQNDYRIENPQNRHQKTHEHNIRQHPINMNDISSAQKASRTFGSIFRKSKHEQGSQSKVGFGNILGNVSKGILQAGQGVLQGAQDVGQSIANVAQGQQRQLPPGIKDQGHLSHSISNQVHRLPNPNTSTFSQSSSQYMVVDKLIDIPSDEIQWFAERLEDAYRKKMIR